MFLRRQLPKTLDLKQFNVRWPWDKPPELWINEVGVAPTHQSTGLGRRLLRALFARGRECECREAWVVTERANLGARRFYARIGGQEDQEPSSCLFSL